HICKFLSRLYSLSVHHTQPSYRYPLSLHDALPISVVADWRTFAQLSSVMQDAVGTPEGFVDRIGQVAVIFFYGSFQIDRVDCRLRMSRRLNLVVYHFQLRHGATQEDDSCPVSRKGFSGDSADTVASTGDKYHFILQRISCSNVTLWYVYHKDSS